MPSQPATRRVSFIVSCAVPVVTTASIAIRALRVPVVYQTAGVALFAVIAWVLWTLGARHMRHASPAIARAATAGAVFGVPSLLTGLLWVGLGIPIEATNAENLMRYEVLLAAAVGITCAFTLLAASLHVEESRYSLLGVTFSLLAGVAYVVWTSVQMGTFVLTLRDGSRSASVAELNDLFDALLFACTALTYLATACFARAFALAGWLSTGASRVYIGICAFALIALAVRGVAFPDPLVGPPWYANIGFVVGIPAVPWIMPYLLGLVVLRRTSRLALAASDGGR